MPTKKTSKKVSKKSPANKAVKGTVAWLIAELKKFPGDMSVLHGDHKDLYYEADALEVLSIREGYIDEEKGEKVVCIRAW